jgi:hypothetical protein
LLGGTISVEDRLSARSSSSSACKAAQDALVKYYVLADQGLLWVDENGLNERGKAAIAEIKKADDYGSPLTMTYPIPTNSNLIVPKPTTGLPTLRSKLATRY